MKFRVKGIVPAMATPLKDEGQRVNFQLLDLLCDFLIDKGVTGLFVLGSTGEGVLFSMEERKQIAERVLKHVHGRVPVIVNCGHITTQGAIELAQHAASVGADAASVVFPYYYPLSAEDAMVHFIAVVRSVPEFPMSRGPSGGERRPSRPRARKPFASFPIATPSCRSASAVAKQSAPTFGPVMSVSPRATAPRRRARWVTDLSPGTGTEPCGDSPGRMR